MIIRPGRPFWTGIWTFAANMVALFGVDQVDLTGADQPLVINNWWAATLLSAFVAVAVYAKAKVDEFNGKEKR